MKRECNYMRGANYIYSMLSLGLIPFVFYNIYISHELTVLAPLPLVVFLPIYFLPRWIVLLLPSLLYLVWNWKYKATGTSIPVRSKIFLVILSLLSFYYFSNGWSAGVRYQGEWHVKMVLCSNIVFVLFLYLLWVASVLKKNAVICLLFNWVLFVWLCWQAFPYLGES